MASRKSRFYEPIPVGEYLAYEETDFKPLSVCKAMVFAVAVYCLYLTCLWYFQGSQVVNVLRILSIPCWLAARYKKLEVCSLPPLVKMNITAAFSADDDEPLENVAVTIFVIFSLTMFSMVLACATSVLPCCRSPPTKQEITNMSTDSFRPRQESSGEESSVALIYFLTGRLQTPGVDQKSMENSLLKWMLMQDIIEIIILIGADSKGLLSLKMGVVPGVWIVLAGWPNSVAVAEIIVFGSVKPLRVLFQMLPIMGPFFTRTMDRVLILICFRLGGVGWVCAGVVAFLCMCALHVCLYRIYSADLVTKYFVAQPAILKSPLHERKGFWGKLLSLLEKSTRNSSFAIALVAIPFAIIESMILFFAQHKPPFVFVQVLSSLGCAILIPLMRIQVLRRLEQWDQLYYIQHLFWNILATILRCMFRSTNLMVFKCRIHQYRCLMKSGDYEGARRGIESAMGDHDEQTGFVARFENKLSSSGIAKLEARWIRADCAFKLAKSKEEKEIAVSLLEANWQEKKQNTALGENDASTLTSMDSYGSALRKLKRWDEAEHIQRKCWELRGETLGQLANDTLTSLNNYASVLRDQKKFQEAVDLHRLCWKLKCDCVGPRKKTTLNIMGSYAASLRDSQGNQREAFAIFQESWLLKWALLGKTHPDTLMTLEDCLKMMRSFPEYQREADDLEYFLKLLHKVKQYEV